MAKNDNRIISLIIIIILLWLLLSPEFMKFIKELTSGSTNGTTAYIPGNKKDPLDTYDPRKKVLVDPNTLERTRTELG